MSDTEHFISKKEQKRIDCFVNVVEEHKTALFRLAFSIVLNKEDAEDAVSDAILKAYSHLEDLKNIKKMKAWLFQILVNESKNCLKKRQKIEFSDVFVDRAPQEAETSDLFEFVCQLEERFREVIILYYFEGFRVKEIAKILEINEGTVKSRLSRARLKLKQYIETNN